MTRQHLFATPPPRRNDSGGTALRLITAIPIIVVAAIMIWVPPINEAFVVLIAVFACIGAGEYHKLCAAKGLVTHRKTGMALAALVCMLAWWGGMPWMMLAYMGGVAIVAFQHILHKDHSIEGLSAAQFGLLYTGLLPAHFALLHAIPLYGPGLVTLLIVAVALSDTGAYFTGRSIGRTKLAPLVSPNKTWEGSIGGVVWAAAGLTIWTVVESRLEYNVTPTWPLWFFVLAGAALAVVSQVGDLIESMLKRDAGVKDSGAIFPGHGGVLDRCDGFLFGGPAMYYLIVVMQGQ